MRKFLFTLTLSISFISAFSQQDSLLKNFKYRIDHYRALNFYADAGGNYQNHDLPASSAKNSNFSSAGNVSYYSLKSTDKKIYTASISIGAGYNNARTDRQNDVDKQRIFQVVPSLQFLNKNFNSKNFFWEWGSMLSAQSATGKINYTTQPFTEKNDLAQYEVALSLGLGKGRLENITDMQNALWLNKALERVNRLVRSLSPEELNGLGRSVTRGNNTRVLDARKRTQFILETVDEYLQTQKLVSNTDIKYFTNLNDILFFAFNSPRLAGEEKFIRLRPSVMGRSSVHEIKDPFQKTKSNFDIYGSVLEIGFGSYKPSSLIHQNNYGVSLKGAWQSGKKTDRFFAAVPPAIEVKDKTDLKQAGVNIFYQHSIFPNTRTTVSFDLQTENGYLDSDDQDGFYSSSSLSASASYFISYRTRFGFDAGLRYYEKTYLGNYYFIPQQNDLHVFVNAGIVVSL